MEQVGPNVKMVPGIPGLVKVSTPKLGDPVIAPAEAGAPDPNQPMFIFYDSESHGCRRYYASWDIAESKPVFTKVRDESKIFATAFDALPVAYLLGRFKYAGVKVRLAKDIGDF